MTVYASERQPLLPSTTTDGSDDLLDSDANGPVAVSRDYVDPRHGEMFDDIPRAKRQLGFWSAAFLIFNRIIGTGIFATPSNILRSSGSVGVSLIMWLIGAAVAAVGTAVYIELGTGLPRSGGDKNYLEYIYRRPRFLVTCICAAYVAVLGSSATNSLVFGEYIAHALGLSPSPATARNIAGLILTLCVILHGCFSKYGLWLQNALGLFKLLILSTISLFGLLSLLGVPGFSIRPEYEVPNNFEWDRLWEGTGETGANALATALFSVIWSFIGFNNANSSLSEVKDPVKTLKRAAPAAMAFVTSVYILTNIAYYAVVSKTDILESKRIVAALFFRNLFGPATERFLSAIIALSVVGNLLAVKFAQARVIQELGREGILPWASVFASNKPFGAPMAGLLLQYVISYITLLAPPAGDAFLFMLSLSSYCSSVIWASVSFGLLLLYTPSYRVWKWNPPFVASKFAVVAFFLSTVFLVIVPIIPPTKSEPYEKLPYWSHPVASIATTLVGVTYWYVCFKWLPRKQGYKLEREWVLQDDGVSRYVFRKVAM